MWLTDPESLPRDERGNTIIQFVLVLPIFIILVFGSYEIWKLVHLKQSLEAATIQASRYLSVEGPFLMDEPPGYPESWRQRAWDIIASELANEPLLQDQPPALDVVIAEPRFGRPQCPDDDATQAATALAEANEAQFALQSQLHIPSPLRIPLVGTAENLVLTEKHWHYLECAPIPPPTPTPTPTP